MYNKQPWTDFIFQQNSYYICRPWNININVNNQNNLYLYLFVGKTDALSNTSHATIVYSNTNFLKYIKYSPQR